MYATMDAAGMADLRSYLLTEESHRRDALMFAIYEDILPNRPGVGGTWNLTEKELASVKPREVHRKEARGLRDSLLSADIVTVGADIARSVAEASLSLPDSAAFSPSMFFSRSMFIEVDRNAVTDCMSIVAVAVELDRTDEDGTPIVLFYPVFEADDKGKDGHATLYPIGVRQNTSVSDAVREIYGRDTPKVSLGTFFRRFLPWFYTLLHFCNERICTHEPDSPGRAAIRRIQREEKEIPRFFRVVLRKTEPRERSSSAGVAVEWDHRWIVRGHWRNQYHPSTGTNHPKWIGPYVKGPDGKPLILKDRIFDVVR